MCRYIPSELSRNEKNLAFRKNVLKKHALETCTSTLFLFPPTYVEETIQGQFNQEAKIKVFQGEATNTGLNDLFSDLSRFFLLNESCRAALPAHIWKELLNRQLIRKTVI